jgi:hypothetical protein
MKNNNVIMFPNEKTRAESGLRKNLKDSLSDCTDLARDTAISDITRYWEISAEGELESFSIDYNFTPEQREAVINGVTPMAVRYQKRIALLHEELIKLRVQVAFCESYHK